MPICPSGHGSQPGRFCPECGSALLADPPAAPSGDSLRMRSPEAHANVNQTFVIPGATLNSDATPSLVKCPKCGRRSPEVDTFDCQGPCGREHLCSRHFDADYDLCTDCASELRRDAEREAAQLAALQTEQQAWRQKAEAATTQAAQSARDLAAAREDLRKGAERGRVLEAEAAAWRARAECAERDLGAANQRWLDMEKELTRYAATEEERRALGYPRVDPVEAFAQGKVEDCVHGVVSRANRRRYATRLLAQYVWEARKAGATDEDIREDLKDATSSVSLTDCDFPDEAFQMADEWK